MSRDSLPRSTRIHRTQARAAIKRTEWRVTKSELLCRTSYPAPKHWMRLVAFRNSIMVGIRHSRRLQAAGQRGLDHSQITPAVERFAGKENRAAVRACERGLCCAFQAWRTNRLRAKASFAQLIARAATTSRVSCFGENPKISPSEASPVSINSPSSTRAKPFVLGPASQPVSTGCSVGCCVHQTGTASSDRRNNRSERS